MLGDARDISQVVSVQINETVSTGFELWDEIVVFCSTIALSQGGPAAVTWPLSSISGVPGHSRTPF